MIETNFKHTDIGPIPHDWEVKRLKDVSSTASGGTPSRNNADYYKGCIPWFTTGELRDCVLCDSIEHISKEAILNSSAKEFKEGTILMAMYGATIGKLGILSQSSTSNQACCALGCEMINNIFLFYELLFNRKYIIEKGFGAAQPNISQNIVRNLFIVVPPLAEQEAIGKALSDIDGLIEGLRKLIEKKRNIKQGAMSRLLSGSLRLPGFNKPWVTRTLGEIGHLIPNNSLSWEYLTNSGKVANIHYGHILTRFGAIVDVSYTQLPYVEKNSEARFLKGNMANDGDIIFADTAEDDTVGKAIELINIGDKHIVSGLHTFWFRPDVEFAHSFLGYAVNGEAFHSQIPLLATGTKVSSISKPNLLKLELHYPTDLAEQSAIAKVLTDMDAEIEGLEKKLAKYEQVKQGMMKQLLTGKIRLI
ncbi:MAG: restriction endonuclease subunit S [Paramuribaculum sp.]|nr:restriction endonuclease subunit S [Paramuribaculum sp.]